MNKEYIVKERIENSLQGVLEVGTILDCIGNHLYLKNGKRTMTLVSANGKKTAPYYRQNIEAEDF